MKTSVIMDWDARFYKHILKVNESQSDFGPGNPPADMNDATSEVNACP